MTAGEDVDPQVPVFVALRRHALVEAARGSEDLAPDDGGGRDAALREHGRNVALEGVVDPAFGAECRDPGARESQLGIGIQPRHGLLEVLRVKTVVGIEKTQKVADGFGGPAFRARARPPCGRRSSRVLGRR